MDAYRPVMEVSQADTQDTDVATWQTVQRMCEHIHQAAEDPVVQRTARLACGVVGVWGCFRWVQHAVKVLPHSQFKALLAAYPEKRQLLISPSVVLRAPNPAGDCSTFSMLIAAMLEALGVQWELVTVAVEPEDPTLYSHVFVRAVSSDGGRVTLDGSHGKYPGWEVPRAHQFRRQVWDESGEPVEDEAPVVSQLHEYTRRPGLGQDDTTDLSNVVTDITGVTAAPTDLAETGVTIPAGSYSPDGGITILPLPAGAQVAPAQSSANWAAFAAQLAKGGMTLAEINAIQPGTVVGSNGQILRQATGLPVPVGTGLTAALGSNTTTVLLLGGAALFLVFMLMQSKR